MNSKASNDKVPEAVNKKQAAENCLIEFLEKDLPSSDSKSVKTELKWNFILDKHLMAKKPKPIRNKNKHLTRSQRSELNLLKLPKDGWNYNDLEAIRNMWSEYMERNLRFVKNTPTCEDPSWSNLSIVLAKSEFIGAEITVVRSNVPSTVGITGTVVLETKSTFQVVTPKSQLKYLLKQPSVFQFILGKRKFTIFGKHLLMKPHERSVKKIKLPMLPDL